MPNGAENGVFKHWRVLSQDGETNHLPHVTRHDWIGLRTPDIKAGWAILNEKRILLLVSNDALDSDTPSIITLRVELQQAGQGHCRDFVGRRVFDHDIREACHAEIRSAELAFSIVTSPANPLQANGGANQLLGLGHIQIPDQRSQSLASEHQI